MLRATASTLLGLALLVSIPRGASAQDDATPPLPPDGAGAGLSRPDAEPPDTVPPDIPAADAPPEDAPPATESGPIRITVAFEDGPPPSHVAPPRLASPPLALPPLDMEATEARLAARAQRRSTRGGPLAAVIAGGAATLVGVLLLTTSQMFLNPDTGAASQELAWSGSIVVGLGTVSLLIGSYFLATERSRPAETAVLTPEGIRF